MVTEMRSITEKPTGNGDALSSDQSQRFDTLKAESWRRETPRPAVLHRRGRAQDASADDRRQRRPIAVAFVVYRKSAAQLEAEARKLRHLSELIIRALETAGLADMKRDEKGNITNLKFRMKAESGNFRVGLPSRGPEFQFGVAAAQPYAYYNAEQHHVQFHGVACCGAERVQPCQG